MFALLLALSEPTDTTKFAPGAKIMPDWSTVEPAIPNAPTKKGEFDPSEALYNSPDMCVVTAGQPIPECAKGTANGLKLSDDIFNTNNIAGNDATCQTVETFQQGSDGKVKRVFATYCGDELQRSDMRNANEPSSSTYAIRPTQRAIGPNEVLPSAN